MRSRTTEGDASADLRKDIHRTGYYPEVVCDGVFSATGGEEVLAYFVHHETTFDHEEVRRHLTALALTTKGPGRAAEAVLTIGWGGVGRLDLEPAGCSDPQCEADHGYTGTLAGDDYNLRISAAAEGEDAVVRLLAFADELSQRTRG